MKHHTKALAQKKISGQPIYEDLICLRQFYSALANRYGEGFEGVHQGPGPCYVYGFIHNIVLLNLGSFLVYKMILDIIFRQSYLLS